MRVAHVSTNWLASTFEWLGDVFEKFNPSAYRFIAAVLPYLTPLPVAWLTSQSSAHVLGFTPNVARIFVFALECMGLWFTSLLVDSVVEMIRSRNAKSIILVAMFGVVVSAYIYILVNLNVTLEEASGRVTKDLSQVITLICFLPLLTGIGNGYYKLKLEQQALSVQNREQEQAERERENDFRRRYRMRKLELKNGTTSGSSISNGTTFETTSGSNYGNGTTSGNSSKTGRPSIHEMEVFSFVEQWISRTGQVPTFSEMVSELKLPNSTISRLRKKWIDTH